MWGFKSPLAHSLTHSGVPTELPRTYRQNALGGPRAMERSSALRGNSDQLSNRHLMTKTGVSRGARGELIELLGGVADGFDQHVINGLETTRFVQCPNRPVCRSAHCAFWCCHCRQFCPMYPVLVPFPADPDSVFRCREKIQGVRDERTTYSEKSTPRSGPMQCWRRPPATVGRQGVASLPFCASQSNARRPASPNRQRASIGDAWTEVNRRVRLPVASGVFAYESQHRESSRRRRPARS